MRISDWSSDVCSSDLVLLIRRIRDLLYEQGFTISGARNRLGDLHDVPHDQDAAVRLSGAELQALRSDLDAVRAMLAGALDKTSPNAGQNGQIGRTSGWERVCQYV